MTTHLNEPDLALMAGEDAGRIRGFYLGRHLRNCPRCQAKVEAFVSLRGQLAQTDLRDELPRLNWNVLAAEMRANIRLGLEAGECVRGAHPKREWGLPFAAAFACLLVLLGAGFFMQESKRGEQPVRVALPAFAESQIPVLESTTDGVELRTGSNSLTLLNREGTTLSQTVSAQGAVRSRNIDGETGAVTINNVYLD